jgi:hypothetical protein
MECGVGAPSLGRKQNGTMYGRKKTKIERRENGRKKGPYAIFP